MSKLVKKSVALKPSRIRREPVPIASPAAPDKLRHWDPRERETWIVGVGVVLFGVAMAIIIIGFSDFLS